MQDKSPAKVGLLPAAPACYTVCKRPDPIGSWKPPPGGNRGPTEQGPAGGWPNREKKRGSENWRGYCPTSNVCAMDPAISWVTMSFSDYRPPQVFTGFMTSAGIPRSRRSPGAGGRGLTPWRILSTSPLLAGKTTVHDLMRRELLTERGPRGMESRIQEQFLDGHQQVVRQHAEEDVRLDPMLPMMEDGALAERALHGPERRLDPREQDVGPPDLVVGHVLPVGLEQVPAVEPAAPAPASLRARPR